MVNYDVPPEVRIVTPVNNQTIGKHATFRSGAVAEDPNDKISNVKFYNEKNLLHTKTCYSLCLLLFSLHERKSAATVLKIKFLVNTLNFSLTLTDFHFVHKQVLQVYRYKSF